MTNYSVANDIGNSSLKMMINDHVLRQPSILKKVLKVPENKEVDLNKAVLELQENLLVNITSNALLRGGLFIVGQRAETLGNPQSMNIKLGNKHTNDIPVVTTLAMIAAKSVQDNFEEKGELETNLDVNVNMMTAIPASEYSTYNAKILENRFKENDHIVIVYVGDQQVTVKIKFNFVKVTQEGIPPLYVIITNKDEHIFKKYNEEYHLKEKGDNFKNKNMLHIDIGDGTCEYIYTEGYKAIPDACSGERQGVGHSAQRAMELLKDHLKLNLKLSRQQFMNIIKNQNHPHHYESLNFMEESNEIEVDSILESLQEKYLENPSIQYFVVYGGGSIVFEKYLYDLIKTFGEQVNAKILWIPKEYAIDMNMKGLKILLDMFLNERKDGNEKE